MNIQILYALRLPPHSAHHLKDILQNTGVGARAELLAPSSPQSATLIFQGGGNHDGAVYAGAVLDTLADDYGSFDAPLPDPALLACTHGGAIASVDAWWADDSDASTSRALREGFGIDPKDGPALMIAMDSD